MVTVNSSEFQQRVGYYMSLVDQGQEVRIRKLKPKTEQVYVLSKLKDKKMKRDGRIEAILKDVEANSLKKGTYKGGLELQERVRS